MNNEKEYTINFKAMPEFDPIEAADANKLFEDEYNKEFMSEARIFDSGLTEAVRRLLRNHNDYDIIKYVRTILNAEYEGAEKDE